MSTVRKQRLELIKSKKNNLANFLPSYWNHPHRLKTICLSGGITAVDDRRLVAPLPPAAFSIRFKTTYTISGDNYLPLKRNFSKDVLLRQSLLDGTYLSTPGEFILYHDAFRPWFFESYMTYTTGVLTAVGTQVSERYQYISGSWVHLDTTTTPIYGYIFINNILGGGDALGGKGPSDPTNEVTFDVVVSGTILPLAGGAVTVSVLPWTSKWPTISTPFNDAATAWAATAPWSAGRTISCSLKLHFINQDSINLDFSKSSNSMYHPSL